METGSNSQDEGQVTNDWQAWKTQAEKKLSSELATAKRAERIVLQKRLARASAEPRPIKEWEFKALMILLEYDAKTNKTKPETKRLLRRLSEWNIKRGRFTLPDKISDRDSELILSHFTLYKRELGYDKRMIENLIKLYGGDHAEAEV